MKTGVEGMTLNAGAQILKESFLLSRFSYFSGLDTTRADFHASHTSLRKLYPDWLKIRVEAARGSIVSM